MHTISVIIPCFNEEEALPVYYEAMTKVMEQMDMAEFELLFVDDGSTDRTLGILKSLNERDERCRYLSFSRNFGKEAAIYAGLGNAKGDYVAIMDVDLQDPPSLLPKMYGILENEEYDSVATKRSTRTGEPKIRSFLSESFYKFINRISKTEIVNGARDYRLMKRKMVDVMIIVIIVRTLIWGDPVSGWPSLVCIIFMVGGIQLFCTGIVGQYLSKTYLETKRRPIFILKDSSDDKDGGEL